MRRWTLIGAKSLIDRPTRFLDGPPCQAALFPFFNHQGQVLEMLVMTADRTDLRVFRPGEVSLRVPWTRPLRLDASFDELRPLDCDLLSRTWHFDPAWKLREPPWRSLPESPPLQRTNCCEEFGWKCPNVYFNGLLTRVVMVAKKTKTESTLLSYKRAHLPAPPELTAPARARPSGWRLAPIWEF